MFIIFCTSCLCFFVIPQYSMYADANNLHQEKWDFPNAKLLHSKGSLKRKVPFNSHSLLEGKRVKEANKVSFSTANQQQADCTKTKYGATVFFSQQHYIFIHVMYLYNLFFLFFLFFLLFSLNTCFYISKIYNTAPLKGNQKELPYSHLRKMSHINLRCRIYRNLLQHRRTWLV